MKQTSSVSGSACAVLVLVLLLLAAPARASCGIAPPMDEAIRSSVAAFVGTVVELENARRWATVEVIDVWKGEVGSRVEVRGGPGGPKGGGTVVTSVDRYMRLGVTYLFVPYLGDGEVFRDNACSRTTRYRDGLARFRPPDAPAPSTSATAHSPTPAPNAEPDPGSWTAGWAVGVSAAVAAVAGVVWVVARRGRRTS